MKVIARRVLEASVVVDGEQVSSIKHGLLLYVGLSKEDNKEQCEYCANKIANLRIFEGKEKEVSVRDLNLEILSVSQFTLSAETKKGTRPSFTQAMPSQEAKPLFDYFNQCLEKELGFAVQTGVFGADMKIPAIDDGPFTIIIEK